MAVKHIGPMIEGNTALVGAQSGGVLIVPAAHHHRSVIVQNISPVSNLYVGSSSGLSSLNGFRLLPNESLSLELHPLATIHVTIAPGADMAECRFLILTGTSSL